MNDDKIIELERKLDGVRESAQVSYLLLVPLLTSFVDVLKKDHPDLLPMVRSVFQTSLDVCIANGVVQEHALESTRSIVALHFGDDKESQQ